MAAAWGLPADTPVAAGGGDTLVAALGSGLLLDGSAQLTTGSGAQIVVLRHTLPAPSAKLNCYRTAAPPGFAALVEHDGGDEMPASRLNGRAAPWGSTGRRHMPRPRKFAPHRRRTVLPALPRRRAHALDGCAGSRGLGRPQPGDGQRRPDARSFEGVAFAIRAGLDALHAQGTRPTQLRLAGGGSVHRAWQQLLMDVLQLPLEAVDCPNASARGAALLGGLAAGHWSTADLYALAPACRPVGEPASVRYALPYRRFCDLYARLAGWFGRDGLQNRELIAGPGKGLTKEGVLMFLGIDLGTSEVKLLLLSEAQRVLAVAGRSSRSPALPGWSEQLAAWWAATSRAAARLRAAAPQAFAAIRAIGLSGQMHGATLLDARSALRPAILWNDTRAAAECEELSARCPALPAIAGNLAMPGFTAPKLRWVAKHEPELFARTAAVLLPKDYLRLCLTGEKVGEMSDAAGTLWLDVARRDWSDEPWRRPASPAATCRALSKATPFPAPCCRPWPRPGACRLA